MEKTVALIEEADKFDDESLDRIVSALHDLTQYIADETNIDHEVNAGHNSGTEWPI